MPLRHIARSPIRLRTLVAGIATCVAVACAERAQQAGASEAASAPEHRAATSAVPPAPVDTVDSLEAVRRATVADTLPLRAVRAVATAAPVAPASTDTSAAATTDTTTRRARPAPPNRGLLGPKSGDRHPAFRDAGSPLDSLWPVKGPAPLPGSILPEKRIVAFYGNPLSKGMGILGATAPDDMLRKLDAEVAAWNRIDPGTPVQPALHLIVLVANGHPGANGLYRTRHDSAMVEKVYGWARSRNALLFLDLQVGRSTLQNELPWIEKFLARPDVHLGIDPEFSMKNGGVPGQRVGTYDAADVNYASRFLAGLVDKYKLPPKILVVHRFTPGGVTNTRKITLDPRVQIVMHMDGFGAPWVKRDTYWRDIKREPVQFTGWKQFTRLRNDRPPTARGEILKLWPVPLYIQIQ
ncbi:MAG TPA: hypothetical protein VGP25_04055 [Gemmatimonadaceae bacterium]|nr:hypothetical protein [Gemmatimonadaceae bacterium]